MNISHKFFSRILLIASLLVLEQVSAVAESQILQIFKSTCLSNGKNFEKLHSYLAANSWVDETNKSPAELGGLFKIFSDNKAKMAQGDGYDDLAVFSRKIDDRQIYVWLESFHYHGKNSVNCTLYDLGGSSQQFVSMNLDSYIGGSPHKIAMFDTITLEWLKPARPDGFDAIRASYVQAGSKLENLAGFHGISLSTNAGKEG